MLRLGRARRERLAETLRDIANIAAGAMVFGQFLGSQPFSFRLAIFGVVMWTTFVAFAITLTEETRL